MFLTFAAVGISLAAGCRPHPPTVSGPPEPTAEVKSIFEQRDGQNFVYTPGQPFERSILAPAFRNEDGQPILRGELTVALTLPIAAPAALSTDSFWRVSRLPVANEHQLTVPFMRVGEDRSWMQEFEVRSWFEGPRAVWSEESSKAGQEGYGLERVLREFPINGQPQPFFAVALPENASHHDAAVLLNFADGTRAARNVSWREEPTNAAKPKDMPEFYVFLNNVPKEVVRAELYIASTRRFKVEVNLPEVKARQTRHSGDLEGAKVELMAVADEKAAWTPSGAPLDIASLPNRQAASAWANAAEGRYLLLVRADPMPEEGIGVLVTTLNQLAGPPMQMLPAGEDMAWVPMEAKPGHQAADLSLYRLSEPEVKLLVDGSNKVIRGSKGWSLRPAKGLDRSPKLELVPPAGEEIIYVLASAVKDESTAMDYGNIWDDGTGKRRIQIAGSIDVESRRGGYDQLSVEAMSSPVLRLYNVALAPAKDSP